MIFISDSGALDGLKVSIGDGSNGLEVSINGGSIVGGGEGELVFVGDADVVGEERRGELETEFVTRDEGVERLEEGRCGSFRPVDPRLLGTTGGLLGQDCDDGKGDPIFNGPEVSGDTFGDTCDGRTFGTMTGFPFCTDTGENETGEKVPTVGTGRSGRGFGMIGTGVTATKEGSKDGLLLLLIRPLIGFNG